MMMPTRKILQDLIILLRHHNTLLQRFCLLQLWIMIFCSFIRSLLFLLQLHFLYIFKLRMIFFKISSFAISTTYCSTSFITIYYFSGSNNNTSNTCSTSFIHSNNHFTSNSILCRFYIPTIYFTTTNYNNSMNNLNHSVFRTCPNYSSSQWHKTIRMW